MDYQQFKAGSAVYFQIKVRDVFELPKDPDSITISIIDPAGETIVEETEMTGDDVGIYSYVHQSADDASITVTVAATSGYYQVASGVTGGSCNGFNFQNARELKTLVSGKYLANWSSTLQCANANQEVEMGVLVGSTEQLNTVNDTELVSVNRDYSLGGTGIVTLSENDIVSLGARNLTATNNLLVNHVNLTLLRVDN